MKYKVLKSAAHNFGHSFVSLLNYRGDDYVMSHLARAAVETGAPELRVDLLSGRAEPQALLEPPIRASVAGYVSWFPELLSSHRIEPQAVRAAAMRVRFEPDRRSTNLGFADAWEIPFECVVTIVDDRGKIHEGLVRDHWCVHGSPTLPRWLRRLAWWYSEVRRWRFQRRLLRRDLPANDGLMPPAELRMAAPRRRIPGYGCGSALGVRRPT